MSFCTTVNCMDGRTQLPVIQYCRAKFGVDYVDSVTEPGPVKILSEQTDQALIDSIVNRITISVTKHGSRSITVAAHYHCAGNPVERPEQERQLGRAIAFLREAFPDVTVEGVWVNDRWEVEEVA